MDELFLTDYRCFRSMQKARLAPLTFLVGENSTGKTSFLAMIRALWDVAYNNTAPDFKQAPYDLGSFNEIAHDRGGGRRAESFQAGFKTGSVCFEVEFRLRQRDTAPFPVVRRVSNANTSVKAIQRNGTVETVAKSPNGEWTENNHWPMEESLMPLYLMAIHHRERREGGTKVGPITRLLSRFGPPSRRDGFGPYASAPVRSKPRRTYDPGRINRDPEGENVPVYLASLFRRPDQKGWQDLKKRLEAFASAAGLFDQLDINSFGPSVGDPFQLLVRKPGAKVKGPWRNLIDMGYGVSQVLPVVTELLRNDAPPTFLLQQPEVHLHPSAQAALGTLLGEVAQDRKMVVVETHSDYMINRVRMDVRDGRGPLKPDQVSILYFEREELEVRIHSLRIDGNGNIRNAPASYGRFFVDEMERELAY